MRDRCPVHGIPDCSPLLNGCSRLTAPRPEGDEGIRPEQKAWDDWNRWGDSVTQTPMIREAHRAGYRRALEDAADELDRRASGGTAFNAAATVVRALSAPDPRETKD